MFNFEAFLYFTFYRRKLANYTFLSFVAQNDDF